MALIVHIETSTELCSVSLARGTKLITTLSGKSINDHAGQLTILIEQVLGSTQTAITEIDAVAISSGPGSYTGLRIGVATAKGLCHALTIPLIAVNTLLAMAHGIQKNNLELNTLLCPLIDARRMDVYTALYTLDFEIKMSSASVSIDKNSYTDFLSTHKIVFFGSGLLKCKEILTHPNSIFVDGYNQSAESLMLIADRYYNTKQFADLHSFEPNYLKNFYLSH